jgi:hypothetical protein
MSRVNSFKRNRLSYYQTFIFVQKKAVIANDGGLGIADAVTVARLGLKKYEQGRRCNINLLAPLYLRRSEAEERLQENC